MVCLKEVRENISLTLIWSLLLAAMLIMVILLFPAMAADMSSLLGMMRNLGPFAQALKLDSLPVNQLIGFYAMESENMLGIAGSFFAAYLGAKLLAKEEGQHTAEFLLSLPIRRRSVYWQKWAALLTLLVIFNLIIMVLAALVIYLGQQSLPWIDFIQLHLALFLVQAFFAGLTYGLSTFFRAENLALSMGLVFLLYFINIIINLWPALKFLRFFTPFQFAYAADILKQGLDWSLIAVFILVTVMVLFLASLHYENKDIQI